MFQYLYKKIWILLQPRGVRVRDVCHGPRLVNGSSLTLVLAETGARFLGWVAPTRIETLAALRPKAICRRRRGLAFPRHHPHRSEAGEYHAQLS